MKKKLHFSRLLCLSLLLCVVHNVKTMLSSREDIRLVEIVRAILESQNPELLMLSFANAQCARRDKYVDESCTVVDSPIFHQIQSVVTKDLIIGGIYFGDIFVEGFNEDTEDVINGLVAMRVSRLGTWVFNFLNKDEETLVSICHNICSKALFDSSIRFVRDNIDSGQKEGFYRENILWRNGVCAYLRVANAQEKIMALK